eukprot:COSAG04_NODE_2567_length_3916_cov_3.837831_3_plen_550_part_00
MDNAPEPPSTAKIAGWKTWYPMDGAEDAPDDSQAGQTQIKTSSSALDAVWELCRYTGRIGAMDVNTDSNARQRDNCNVDSHITAMHQAAAAPLASARYRRRNAAFLFEPDAHVHPWSEFKLFSIGAVHEYTLDTGDVSLANETFDEMVAHYSLTQFIDHTDGLVHKPPSVGIPHGLPTQKTNDAQYYYLVYQDLIDWPNAVDALNPPGFAEGETCCKDGHEGSNITTAINGHVAHAHRRLADMARWIGRPAAEAARYDALADGIVRGLREMKVGGAASDIQCVPAAPACFVDGLGLPAPDSKTPNISLTTPIKHTSVQASIFVAGCGLLPPSEALELLPFLKAKTARFPLFSAMASNFMLEALYRAATADLTSEAADFAYEILTRSGHRSWLEMIEHGATMAIEHWYGTSIEKHTWSHPWSASPARIIPQWLLGVRPLDLAWRRVAVHPQPGAKLAQASMRVPTMRGEIVLEYTKEDGGFTLALSLPGNTAAEVCLPAGLIAAKKPAVTVNGAAAPVAAPDGRPGQWCLLGELGGGAHHIVAGQAGGRP